MPTYKLVLEKLTCLQCGKPAKYETFDNKDRSQGYRCEQCDSDVPMGEVMYGYNTVKVGK